MMPRGKQSPDGNEAYAMRDAFRASAYKIGIEALKIDEMMQSKLWKAGIRRMPKPAYDDLRAAQEQLSAACTAIRLILVTAADREEEQ